MTWEWAAMTNSTSSTSSVGDEKRRPRPRRSTGRPLIHNREQLGTSFTWWESGLCRGADPALFFPPEDSRRVKQDLEEAAKALCARCPVRRTCLNHALTVPEQFGVWGGTTEIERRQLQTALFHSTNPAAGKRLEPAE